MNEPTSENANHRAMPAVIPTRNIQPEQIDPDALKVVRRLQRFGYCAYLVGGCVRDLLLKRTPKDFDVATSAHPPEIRKVFRNCRLIGRRFRLAHIHFRQKVIETATFRAGGADAGNGVNPPEGDLLIRSDNVFGTEEEDACRRDFTINALFYDPVRRDLIDYVGGLEDLVSRTVRFIGEPEIRVREDPVRILRAIKFAARLDFVIEERAWQAMVRHRQDLTKSAPPRLLEEILRMLRGKGAEASFRMMWEAKVLEVLLPEVATFLARAPDRGEVRDPNASLFAYLRAVDRWPGATPSDPVLLAAVLIHPVMDAAGRGCEAYRFKSKGGAPGDVAHQMLHPLVERLRLPRWEFERIQQLVSCQKRLFHLRPKEPLPRSLMRRAYFEEAVDLMELGVQATGNGKTALSRLRGLSRNLPPTREIGTPEHSGRRRRTRRRGRGARPVDNKAPISQT